MKQRHLPCSITALWFCQVLALRLGKPLTLVDTQNKAHMSMGLLITNFISFGRKLFFSFCSYCLHPPPFPACRKVCLGMALKIHFVFLYLFHENCHLSQHCLGLALAIPEVPPELLFLQLLPVLISEERQDRGPNLLSHTARAPAAPTAVLLSASQVCSCMLYQHF